MQEEKRRELGRPHRLPEVKVRHAVIETRTGKPRNGIRPKSGARLAGKLYRPRREGSRKLVGSQTGSQYCEHGKAVHIGKGPAKLRRQQRKLHPDKQDWTMKQTSLLGIANKADADDDETSQAGLRKFGHPKEGGWKVQVVVALAVTP
jgi:hypothetical protein